MLPIQLARPPDKSKSSSSDTRGPTLSDVASVTRTGAPCVSVVKSETGIRLIICVGSLSGPIAASIPPGWSRVALRGACPLRPAFHTPPSWTLSWRGLALLFLEAVTISQRMLLTMEAGKRWRRRCGQIWPELAQSGQFRPEHVLILASVWPNSANSVHKSAQMSPKLVQDWPRLARLGQFCSKQRRGTGVGHIF